MMKFFKRRKKKDYFETFKKIDATRWIGHTVMEVGHTVREIAHTVREIGHTVMGR